MPKNSLISAARNGNLEKIKSLLDEKGGDIDIDAFDNNNHTALIWASLNGHTQIVRKLLDNGADTDFSDNRGHTALILAALNGYIEIVRRLLDKGADVNAANNEGHT